MQRMWLDRIPFPLKIWHSMPLTIGIRKITILVATITICFIFTARCQYLSYSVLFAFFYIRWNLNDRYRIMIVKPCTGCRWYPCESMSYKCVSGRRRRPDIYNILLVGRILYPTYCTGALPTYTRVSGSPCCVSAITPRIPESLVRRVTAATGV